MKILGSYRPELKKIQENPLKRFLNRDNLLFVLRHGRIKGAEEKRFIGKTDIALSDMGIEQGQYWGKMLSIFDIDHLYSGDLKRCTSTVKSLGMNIPHKTEKSLNEINLGVLDGLSFDYVKNNYPEEFKKRGERIGDFRPLHGESFKDLMNRTVPFWNRIEKFKGNTLVVTHAGVIRILLVKISGLELKDIFSIQVDYGELFILEKNLF